MEHLDTAQRKVQRRRVGVYVVVVIIACVVVAFVVSLGYWQEPVKAPGPERDVEQWCVWEHDSQIAHYVNRQISDTAITACGREIPVAGGLNTMTTIDRMEVQRKVPCSDCMRALQRYIDSVNVRPREFLPEREQPPTK